MFELALHGGLVLALGLLGCSGIAAPADFANPEKVTILGYDDHAMEPFLSRDGHYLFFNNLNDPRVNTDLHWAERIDDLHFRYKGPIGGVNTDALEGVVSMDRDNRLYFVSPRSYNQTASTLYRGTFSAGTITGIELVPGVSTATPGIVNFDAEISPDGNTLYFVESRFGASGPSTADILIAERSGSTFVRSRNGKAIMKNLNSRALEYAPAISASGLEIFFTRLKGGDAGIFVATRPSISAPFGVPRRITAITGFAEGPTLSSDGRSLYYHLREGGRFAIYRVTRP